MSLLKNREPRPISSFEQCAIRTELVLPQGSATVLEGRPEHPIGVVTFLPGFGHDSYVVKGPLSVLFEQNFRVLCTDYKRRGMKHEPDTTEAQKEAAIVSGVLHLLEIDLPTNVTAHSRSTKTAVRLAEAGVVDAMVLLNPPLSEPQTVPGLVRRAGISMVRGAGQVLFDRSTRIAQPNHFKSTFEVIRESGPKDTVSVLRETAHVDLRPRLRRLHEQGVYIAVLHAEDDKTFPLSEVQEGIEEAQVDHFKVLPGDHTNHLKNPKLVMGEVARILKNRPIQR